MPLWDIIYTPCLTINQKAMGLNPGWNSLISGVLSLQRHGCSHLKDDTLKDCEYSDYYSVQTEDDIIQLNGVYSSRVLVHILLLEVNSTVF